MLKSVRILRRSAPLTAACSLVLALTVACGGGGDGGTGPGNGGGGGGGGGGATVANVVVSPSTATIAVGGTATLTATPTDANGTTVGGQTIAWSSSNQAVATVSSSGVVTAVSGGTATITAATAGKSGSAVITVTAPVASISVSPSTATLYSYVADTTLNWTQLAVTLKDANGNPLSGRTVTYTSSNPNIATVSSSGVVLRNPNNSAPSAVDTITVTSEGKSAISVITVLRPAVAQVKVTPASATIHVNGSVTVNIDLYDNQGRLLGNRLLSQPVATPAGIVSASNATITGVAPGTATVTYSSEGVSGSTTITVVP